MSGRTRGWKGVVVTNPHCAPVVLAMALAPLRPFGITRVNVTTMQAVSGAGYPGVPSYDILGNLVVDAGLNPAELAYLAGRVREPSVVRRRVGVAVAITAWIVLVVVPLITALMLFIHRQYRASAAQLAVRPDLVVPSPHREERVVVPIPGLNRSVVQAINVARSIDDDVRAVFITEDPARAEELREQWERQVPHVPLVVVESPYRALAGPLIAYLDVLDRAWPPDREAPITFVVIPEYVARHWWERILYNQSARRLKAALVGREHTVIADVPYRRAH